LLWLGKFKTAGCLVERPTCAPATTRSTPQLVGISKIADNLSPYIGSQTGNRTSAPWVRATNPLIVA